MKKKKWINCLSNSLALLLVFSLPSVAENTASQNLQSAIQTARQELDDLRERQKVAEEKCSNIPADEPYPDEVRAECAKLKNTLRERIEKTEDSVVLLNNIAKFSDTTQKIEDEAQKKLTRLQEIQSGKAGKVGGNAGAKTQPAYGKLSQISRKRFEKAFPHIAERLGHWDEVSRLFERGKADLDASKANTYECGKLQVAAGKTHNSLAMAHANALYYERAKKAEESAGKAHYQAQQAVSRYKAAYDHVVEFQGLVGSVGRGQLYFNTYSDPVMTSKATAIMNSLMTAVERRDIKPSITLFDTCSGAGPCRPQIVGASLPDGSIYLEKAFLDQNPTDAAIAFVIAHELAHVDCYHWGQDNAREREIFEGDLSFVNERIRHLVIPGLMASQNRPQELEADQVGREYLAKTMSKYAQDGPQDFLNWLDTYEGSINLAIKGRLGKNKRFPTQAQKDAAYTKITTEEKIVDEHPDAKERKKNLGVK